ncbi:type II toxin-antitoxin system VapC family toxin [Sphingomonas sanxanigenens]|uniref:PIN domain-containing protein n=1 Tax=Sphingomonas sanxanigenens DSM 19645 = NX02 TaxID=1123269 RepID=W0ANZ1_9SPHN|nr:type II toxin-antitoxin system VapC family toxin [Sphingomonas sanxanigenens]AHE55556.1 hypothetical protein NX02_19480 [Sphingomonas sanxanigenens DSM 19645 = NX02]AHE57450.1 hypothetical protein NX02_29430 [Sphingomonas sanxanigenens DSM 19645 = NX02]
MKVAIDASVLVYLLDEDAPPPRAEEGRQLVARCADRMRFFIASLQRSRSTIIVPTPALTEILARATADRSSEWLRIIETTKYIRVSPFDELAAIECALLAQARIVGVSKAQKETRRKAKFDEQILAISIVERADLLLTDDGGLRSLASQYLEVKGIGDLDLPPVDPQTNFFADIERKIDLDAPDDL